MPPEELCGRHAKSQNGCPKDARSAQPVRREPAATGAGEGAPGAPSPLASRSRSGSGYSHPLPYPLNDIWEELAKGEKNDQVLPYGEQTRADPTV